MVLPDPLHAKWTRRIKQQQQQQKSFGSKGHLEVYKDIEKV